MLFRALVFKYTSNTFAYKKSIRKFIFEQRRPDMILFKYNISYEDEGEYLQIYIGKKKRLEIMKRIINYYKYHNEVPRWFMKDIAKTMRKYHDRQRKIKYSRLNGCQRIETWIIRTEQDTFSKGMMQMSELD